MGSAFSSIQYRSKIDANDKLLGVFICCSRSCLLLNGIGQADSIEQCNMLDIRVFFFDS